MNNVYLQHRKTKIYTENVLKANNTLCRDVMKLKLNAVAIKCRPEKDTPCGIVSGLNL